MMTKFGRKYIKFVHREQLAQMKLIKEVLVTTSRSRNFKKIV